MRTRAPVRTRPTQPASSRSGTSTISATPARPEGGHTGFFAEYCTGNARTPFSTCGLITGGQTPPGWIGAAGTSLSSPLWSAIIADRDSFLGHRSGNINPLLYLLYDFDPNRFFHDITGIGQRADNNGLFPVVPGYDLATGIGTPKMAALITGTF